MTVNPFSLFLEDSASKKEPAFGVAAHRFVEAFRKFTSLTRNLLLVRLTKPHLRRENETKTIFSRDRLPQHESENARNSQIQIALSTLP